MNVGLLTLQLIPLLLVCSCGPGLLIVGRLRWSPMEKLCGIFLASFIALYLTGFTFFCLHDGTVACWTAASISALMGMLGWRTGWLLLRHDSTRATLLAFAALLAWDFLHLAMVRNYSGGGWRGDWREHYDRTQYFLNDLPMHYVFVGGYSPAARPPMMNVIAAFFCRLVGMRFESFSLVFLFLNAWAFVPCCWLMRVLSPPRGKLQGILLVFFMLNPSIIENATLTVTKAFAAGLVVLGVCFYLRRRTVASSLSFAAGILVHFSAAPFAVAVALHCLWRSMHHRRPIPLVAASAGAALLAPWFIWSTVVLGAHATFLSNTTATGTAERSLTDNIRKVAFNMFTSLVPHPLHPIADKQFGKLANWGEIRDYYFIMSQQALPTMIGLAGGIIATIMFARLYFRGPRTNQRAFWLFFVPFSFVLATAANPDYEPVGCGQVALQSLALMGVTWVAVSAMSLSPTGFGLLIVGMAIDYSLGVLLQFNRQSYVFDHIRDQAGRLRFRFDPSLGMVGLHEYAAKLKQGYIFWADHWPALIPALEVASAAIAILALARLIHFRRRHEDFAVFRTPI